MILGAIYHPPKPIYDIDMLRNFLECSCAEISKQFPEYKIVLAGDINKLSVNEISQRTGLISINHSPSRGRNVLDNAFLSHVGEYKIKVIESTVSSDHKALILYSDRQITNQNKQHRKVGFRKKTPALNEIFLSSVKDDCFQEVLNIDEVQLATDKFYSVASDLLNSFTQSKTSPLPKKTPNS